MNSLRKIIESIQGKCILHDELSSSPISKVFLCLFNDVKAVIRIDVMLASKLAIDRKNEFRILKNIAHLDLSPQVLYSDNLAGILIWKYIHGNKPVFDGSGSMHNSLSELGRSLYLIHNFSMAQNSINIFSNSLDFYQKLSNKIANKFIFDNAINLYKELIDDGVKLVLCHNDLHQGNLLWNKKFYFLDWEFSALNHPCFDIASLIKTFQLTDRQIYYLSIGYGPNIKIFNLATLKKWIEFIDYLEIIWELSIKKIQIDQ